MRLAVWCAGTEMDEDSAEKAKADRAVNIILLVMVIGTILPFVLFYFFR
jgi:hypothetical protein